MFKKKSRMEPRQYRNRHLIPMFIWTPCIYIKNTVFYVFSETHKLWNLKTTFKKSCVSKELSLCHRILLSMQPDGVTP